MKRILIFCALLLTACQKNLLDTTPYSSVSSATMWTTDNLTDLGVAGVYSGLRLGVGNSSNGITFEIYELDRFSSTSQTRFDEPLLNGTITAGDGLFSTFWKNFYEGIQRANDGVEQFFSKVRRIGELFLGIARGLFPKRFGFQQFAPNHVVHVNELVLVGQSISSAKAFYECALKARCNRSVKNLSCSSISLPFRLIRYIPKCLL